MITRLNPNAGTRHDLIQMFGDPHQTRLSVFDPDQTPLSVFDANPTHLRTIQFEFQDETRITSSRVSFPFFFSFFLMQALRRPLSLKLSQVWFKITGQQHDPAPVLADVSAQLTHPVQPCPLRSTADPNLGLFWQQSLPLPSPAIT